MVITETFVGGGGVPTRGRPVATPGGPLQPRPTSSGGGGFLGRFGRGLGTAGKVAGGIGGAALGFAAGPEFWIPVVAAGILHERFDHPPTDAELADQRQRARDVLADPKARAAIRAQLGPRALAQLAVIAGTSSGLTTRPDEGSRRVPTTTTPARPSTKPPGGGNAPTPRTLLDIETDLARARTTATTTDDVRLLTEERDLYRKRISFLESRKTLTDKSKQELQRLYGELGSAQSELDGLQDDREKAIADAREARQRKRAAEARKRAAALKRQQAADLKERLDEAKSLTIGAKKQVEARFPIGDKTLGRIDPDKLAAGRRDSGPTPEQTQFAQEILKGVGAIFENYYGNVVAGQQQTSTAMLEHLTREQTSVIRDAFGRPRVGFTRHLDEAVMGL
jgi:hypothetical protein